MLIILFTFLIAGVMLKRAIDWYRIDSKISEAMNWSIADGTLLDFQSVDTVRRGLSKLGNHQQHYAFAVFEIEGKRIGCQRISFYPNTHIINSDYFNEIPTDNTVMIWYDPKDPSESVLLPPEQHEKGTLLLKFAVFELLCAFMITIALTI